MKILVTGANGYLGMGIVRQLLDEGINVIATDYSSENIDERAVIKITDIFSISNPFDYFEQPDVVLHLAWRNGFVHNALNHIEDIPMHYLFLKRMVDAGVKRMAVMGSMHEIGFYEGCIDESTPTNPQSLYGIAKDTLRKSVALLAEENGVPYQWLRGYYIVGNSENGCSIFSKITSAVKEGKKVFPFTTGQNQWDFIDYDEFCIQVAATVKQEKITNIINICSGYPEKLADRVERFIKDNHYQIQLEYGAFEDRKYDSRAVWGNNKKIQKILLNN